MTPADPERARPRRASVVAAALAVVPAIVGPVGASGQWHVGAVGGLASFGVGGDAPTGTSYRSRVRTSAALTLGLELGEAVLLRLEPGFVQKGAGIAFGVPFVEDPVDSLWLDLEYVSVPVVVHVRSPGGRGFVTTGLDLGYLSSAHLGIVDTELSADVADDLEPLELAWLFGVGAVLRRRRPELSLELRYAQSLTKVYQGDADGPDPLPDGFRSSGFGLSAGITWRLGGAR